jgi:hypothetical protein
MGALIESSNSYPQTMDIDFQNSQKHKNSAQNMLAYQRYFGARS